MRTRRLPTIWVFVMVLAAPAAAAAEDPRAAEGPSVFSMRAAGGLGPGTGGLALHGALSGEGWFAEGAGLGAFVGASSQSDFCLFCARTTYDARFAGVSLALRAGRRRSYGYLSLGLGYAWGQKTVTGECTTFGGGCSAPPGPSALASALFDSTLAWLWHPGGVIEIGPAVNLELADWGAQATLNFELGFSLTP
jgi:hypothetical protein